ncbi:hypothetical protein IV203_035249 [Nitzschia inconspicua]|uniref:Uncharacterized protein n=1 Tax=Nitzschia inconspicua TaxID=303405 RepID=A0A9K3LE14_9STRA|nr:hypothetical protein IV203_035249 [Nitzschia inconspicua]
MTSSYQNSVPGELTASVSAVTEPGTTTAWTPIEGHENGRMGGRTSRFLLAMGVTLFLFVVYTGLLPHNVSSLRGSEVSLLQQPPLADAAPADMPEPDYNGEGRYDWQKCKASNDPDCWKNEGDRVGGYWHNFGLRMMSFWENFRKTIHDFFAGGGDTTHEAVKEETVKTEKKHHNKKKDVPETTVNATVTP